jgi:hypothetical protein
MARRWLKAIGIAASCVALVPAAGGLLYGATRTSPCDRPELTASIGGSQDSLPQPSGLDRLTIVLAGDTGFNATDAKVDQRGMVKGKQVTSFTDMLSGISRDVDGDLAFVNLETVVTDRNDLTPEGKGKGAFHFRSHPAALKALIDTGFNLFALANNHSYDYGGAGIEETLYHLAVANAEQKAQRQNEPIDVDRLRVRYAVVNEGATLKRYGSAAMGRATPILKRTSHVEIRVAPDPAPAPKAAPPAAKGAPAKRTKAAKAASPAPKRPEARAASGSTKKKGTK